LHRGISEFKRDYHHRRNLVKDEKGCGLPQYFEYAEESILSVTAYMYTWG